MAKVSEFTEVVRTLVKEGQTLRQAAAKSNAIPIGQERLSRGEARTRAKTLTPQDLTAMTPQQRQALLNEVGTEAVVDIIRSGRSAVGGKGG